MEIHKGYSERGQVGVCMQWRGAGVTGRFWFVVGRFMPQAHRHYRLSTYLQCEEKKRTRPHLRYLTSGPKKGQGGGGLIPINKCSRNREIEKIHVSQRSPWNGREYDIHHIVTTYGKTRKIPEKFSKAKKWNEYVTIAVNRNLSNCENSPKKGFSGLQRDSNPWPLR